MLPDCVKGELEALASGSGRRARIARVALQLAAGFETEKCGGARVDDEVSSAALTLGARVATTDSELIESLKALHVGVVMLRSGRVSVG